MFMPPELASHEKHLTKVLSSDRFLRMEGLANEVPHFIYDYDPSWELPVQRMTQTLKKNLHSSGIDVYEIDLYDLCVRLLKERNIWDRILDREPSMDKDAFIKPLRNMLDPEKHLKPAIAEEIADKDFQILFITGVGKVFPVIRSHTILNNLQTVVNDRPLVLFFPGRYDVTNSQGSALVLFGQLTDDSFYRAKRILDQEV